LPQPERLTSNDGQLRRKISLQTPLGRSSNKHGTSNCLTICLFAANYSLSIASTTFFCISPLYLLIRAKRATICAHLWRCFLEGSSCATHGRGRPPPPTFQITSRCRGRGGTQKSEETQSHTLDVDWLQVYYFNAVSNESSWSKPAGFAGEATDAKPTSQMRVPGTDWFEVHCDDGRKYYYNDRAEVSPSFRHHHALTCSPKTNASCRP
jgi:hypothetical protein